MARAMQSRNSKLILCPFCFLDKIDSPFCLQNCFFLLAAHFAQILLSKFCQGLVKTMVLPLRRTWQLWIRRSTYSSSGLVISMLAPLQPVWVECSRAFRANSCFLTSLSLLRLLVRQYTRTTDTLLFHQLVTDGICHMLYLIKCFSNLGRLIFQDGPCSLL